MNFNRPGHGDNLLFVVLLLLPSVYVGARYFESERHKDQIAQLQAQRRSVAAGQPAQAELRIADARSNGRR
jgi:hypothetical protein